MNTGKNKTEKQKNRKAEKLKNRGNRHFLKSDCKLILSTLSWKKLIIEKSEFSCSQLFVIRLFSVSDVLETPGIGQRTRLITALISMLRSAIGVNALTEPTKKVLNAKHK